MGRLAGFKYHRIIKKLKSLGFEFYRHASGSHEIWYSTTSDRFTTIPRHNSDMPEGTMIAIIKQAGITNQEFLDA